MSSSDSSKSEQQSMADENPQVQPQLTEEQKLKYLQFVQIATVHTVLCLGKLYAFAKERTGPLRPGVESAEGTVKTVVGPVYEKFHDIPIEVLKYLDGKVGESMTELDRRVPLAIKQVTQVAPAAAQSVAEEVKRAGVVDAASDFAKSVYCKCEPKAKELYIKYEPKAEQYAVSAWQRLNQLPLFPKVAQVVVPTAAYCSDKYNETVKSTAEKGYRVSYYLPLVPTAKIAKVFSNDQALKEPLVSSGN